MRNWNPDMYACSANKQSVFIVPMRNWNCGWLHRKRDHGSVFIVPMRNWNGIKNWVQANEVAFLSYLWGIETTITAICFADLRVFIVPMRNWNFAWTMFKFAENIVFIVPMRNWNPKSADACSAVFCLFLSYLWGIETRSRFMTHEIFIHVFIVPMRNWNYHRPR